MQQTKGTQIGGGALATWGFRAGVLSMVWVHILSSVISKADVQT